MRSPRNTSRRSPRRGAATVELALLLPLLMFLLVGVIDFARVFRYSIIIANCARNGALYGSNASLAEDLPYASVKDAALADTADLPQAPQVTVAYGFDRYGAPYVEVSVSYPFTTVTHYPGFNDITITRKARMRLTPATIDQ